MNDLWGAEAYQSAFGQGELMPKKAIRRMGPPARAPIEVRLSEREGVRIGREILGEPDPAKRGEALKELERILGAWAEAIANARYVGLRSDLLARAKPLAARAETFWNAMHREPEVLTFAIFKKFLDLDAMRTQLQSFQKLVDWIGEERSKRGGEPRAFLKQTNEEWKAQVRLFLARHSQYIPKGDEAKRESQLLRVARAAVDRAMRSQKSVE